jgi:preprotein translocase subunit SecY
MRWSRDLWKRIGLTVLLLAVGRAGRLVPLPGLPPAITNFLLGNSPEGLGHFSLFGLGLKPYISGSVLVLLASGAIPALRRLREAHGAARKSFERLFVVTGAVVAIIQAYGLWIFLRNTAGQFGGAASLGGTTAVLFLCSAVAGMLVLVWIARLITIHGIGNGLALLLALDILEPIARALRGPHHTFEGVGHSVILSIAALLVMATLCVVLLHARRRIPIERVGSPGGGQTDDRLLLDVRLIPAGMIPVYVAGIIVTIPATLASFGLIGRGPLTNPSSFLNNALLVVLVFIATFFFAAFWFSGRQIGSTLKRFGYVVPGVGDGEDAGRYLDRVQEKLMVPGGIILAVLALLPIRSIFFEPLHPEIAALLGAGLLAVTAVALDTARQIRGEAAWGEAPSRELVSFDTELEARLTQRVLLRSGVPAFIRSKPVFPVVGTFALWELCRPLYPAIAIDRHLGGSGPVLIVRTADYERAMAAIAPLATTPPPLPEPPRGA